MPTCAHSPVTIAVEAGARNSRRLFAGVDVAAPPPAVWAALTSYSQLGTFIPGLVVNRVLQTRRGGAQVLQIGQAEVAFGWKFTARCVLDIQEWERGVPAAMCGPDDGGGVFPSPRSPLATPHRDISFELVNGDFELFQGMWRTQAQTRPAGGCRLSYSLLVRPHPWLPVGLIQPRVEREVVANLGAVARYCEANQARLGAGALRVEEA